MRRHPLFAEQLIGSHPIVAEEVRAVRHHHERWDGRGYPAGLKGEQIHIFGRITAIADVFDALCAPRPYKRPWSLTDAADYLRSERDRQFDGVCVEAFLNNWTYIETIAQELADANLASEPKRHGQSQA